MPSKEELERLNNNLLTQCEIAIKYNVSQGTISNWFKKYNIKSKTTTGGAYNTKDLVGEKFGKLTVLKYDHTGKYGKHYLCKCDCGGYKIVLGTSLTRGITSSCGCIIGKQNINKQHNKLAKSLIGKRYNFLTIIGFEKDEKSKNRSYYMICKCDCGNITKQIYADLKIGKVKSCGCYQKEQASKTGSFIGLNNYKSKYNWYFIKDDEKVKCRSGFEVIYANYLIKNNIEFQYEPKCFKLDNGRRYTPDFYLINKDKYIEIKGSFKTNEKYNHQKENIKDFEENHNWEILYWVDIVDKCNLPLKSYDSYLRRARKLNIKEEDYLANLYIYI